MVTRPIQESLCPAPAYLEMVTSKTNDLRVKRGKIAIPRAIARSRKGLLPEGKGLLPEGKGLLPEGKGLRVVIRNTIRKSGKICKKSCFFSVFVYFK